jgi:pimeloyl-ACP methyl ester carboxylesterase
VWKPVAQAFADTYHVLALDQRGHGDSAKPDTGYEWERFAEDLERFLEAVGVTRVTAIGHSAGATTIVLLAARNPARLARAVLIDPILIPRLPAGHAFENPMAHLARKRRMTWDSRTAIFHSYRVRAPFKTWREDVLWAYIEEGTALRPDGKVELKCPGRIEAQVFENAPRLDGFAALPAVHLPVLLLRGEHSDAFHAESAAQAVAAMPSATLVTVPGTTHFLPMERPDAVEKEIRAFLGTAGTAGPTS